MTDHFALLHEPRRPWLEPEALKEKFLRLSAVVHPDRVHQATEADRVTANLRYTELNAAYHCLREPRNRLRHLLELELGRKPSDLTHVPEDLMDLFFNVGKLLREVDAFVVQKAEASSPLLQVQFFEQGQEWIAKLEAAQQVVNGRREPLISELQALGATWESHSEKPYGRLLDIWRLLSFYDRWLAQLQEQVVRLSF